jgi:hypothetical protein
MGPAFDSNYSKVQVLWHLGNFFKHHEEWPASVWSSPSSQQELTIRVLSAAGLESKAKAGLRTGARSLGNTEYWQLNSFVKIVREWANGIRMEAYRAVEGRKAPTANSAAGPATPV